MSSSSNNNHFLSDTSFLPDPFSPFPNYELDFQILQEISSDPIAIFSSSPPSHLLQNLNLQNSSPVSANPQLDSSVKSEECQFPDLYSAYNTNHYFNGSGIDHYSNYEHGQEKIMQRSFSSKSFDGKPANCFFYQQPRFDQNIHPQSHTLNSPENTLRRVCSTGDLQVKSREGLVVEESSILKGGPGRYTAEERKERIHRYRAKKTQRNFNKTIKYACRKTLADNRPRIRGRFARNDEPSSDHIIPNPATFNRYEDEDNLWIDNLNDDEDEGTVRGGHVFNLLSPTQLQYYSY